MIGGEFGFGFFCWLLGGFVCVLVGGVGRFWCVVCD